MFNQGCLHKRQMIPLSLVRDLSHMTLFCLLPIKIKLLHQTRMEFLMHQSIKQRTFPGLWEAGRSVSCSVLAHFTLAHVFAPLQPIAVGRPEFKDPASGQPSSAGREAQDVNCPLCYLPHSNRERNFLTRRRSLATAQ